MTAGLPGWNTSIELRADISLRALVFQVNEPTHFYRECTAAYVNLPPRT